MKRARTLLVLAVVSIGLPAAGCHKPASPGTPTVARVTAQTPDDYQELFQAVADTLRRYYLPPDRQDRGRGVITTHPVTSAHWFEWWRPQPQPAYLWSEANLHNIRRQATVHIHPTDEQGTCELDVQIDRYRQSLEERQIDNPAAVLRLYSSAAPTVSGQSLKPDESADWIHLGRDQRMERAVLAAILRRYGTTTVADTWPDQPPDQP